MLLSEPSGRCCYSDATVRFVTVLSWELWFQRFRTKVLKLRPQGQIGADGSHKPIPHVVSSELGMNV